MHHTLNRKEYKELLYVECLNTRTFDAEFKHLEIFLEDCKSWDRKVSGLNHLLTIIIEQFQKENIVIQPLIDFVYSLKECQDFEIQEGGLQFIESLFKNDYKAEKDIEEDLQIAQNRIYRGR